ncbi:MAG: Maf family protein [Candidatus Peregrinibacteria bacterium]|nr:Maf family protein [Candidatus Peregrinibacteria bacterium]
MKLILASQSPQRKKILKEMGLSFDVVPADIDEHHDGLKSPHAIAQSIALRKAQAVGASRSDSWIIGCDTIVVLADGRIALKPKDRQDAKRTLMSYKDSYCNVYSGLSLINPTKGISHSGYERTKIVFHDFSHKMVEEYLDSGEWKGRSGAMTIEGKGDWVRYMEGGYWNVVGLPVDLLKNMLKKAGLV